MLGFDNLIYGRLSLVREKESIDGTNDYGTIIWNKR